MEQLPKIPKVRNLESPRSGEPVKNQFIIEWGDFEIFQSYKTIIAIRKNDGGVIIDNNALHYSVTTPKYLYDFLNMNRQDILRNLAANFIQAQDLNNG